MSAVAVYDKRGKEAYFREDITERTLEDAVTLKQVHPTWTILTDDLGYFQRAHEESSNRWQEYDVFQSILVTACITGSLWVLINCLETYKFGTVKWNLALPVRRDHDAHRDWWLTW